MSVTKECHCQLSQNISLSSLLLPLEQILEEILFIIYHF
jgi:hypothetical protein